MSLTEYGARIAGARTTTDLIEMGPWKGYRSSVPADRIPKEYAAPGSENFLFRPRTGTWKRRRGQDVKFSSSTTSLLPGAWVAKGRQLEEYTGDDITDGIPTLMALATKETIASGLDDGRFSNIWIRDQVNDLNYTVGSEYSSGTYPSPGTEATYKYVPLWYDSGAGGMTRGISEFQRRLFFGGSRNIQKVGRWTFAPSVNGTPSRWFSAESTATGEGTPIVPTGDVGGEWALESVGGVNGKWGIADLSGSFSTAYQSLDTDDSDTGFVFINNAASNAFPYNSTLTFPTLSASYTRWFIRLRAKLTSAYAGLLRIRLRITLSDGNTYEPDDINVSTMTPGSYTDLEFAVDTATDLVSTGTANRIVLNANFPDQSPGSFSPGLYITKLSAVPVTVAFGAASRLIPSGPLPALHAGTLTAGDEIETNAVFMRPDADVSNTSWTASDLGATEYTMLDEPTADNSDYVESAGGATAANFIVRLSDLGFTPSSDDTVTIHVRALKETAFVGLTVHLVEDPSGAATVRSGFICTLGGTATDVTKTLTESDMSDIVDWTNLGLKFTKTSSLTGGYIRVFYADVSSTNSASVQALDGGWRGSDRFYHSVAFRDEYGAVWMPCVPRGPNDTLPNGYNMFTVNSSNPTAGYEKLTWSNIPIGPYGTQSRLLLRSLKIDSSQDSTLQLDPYDLRVVWEIKDNTTTTYDDFFADDDALTEDPDGLFIHFDHRMPPRARYSFGGASRVCHSYGGENPAAIIFAPVSFANATTYDRNLDDENSTLWGANTFYYRVTTTALELYSDTGSALSSATSLAFDDYPTLEKLVDAINATTITSNCKMWRAQLAPGANSNADPEVALMPTVRSVSSCVVSGQTITKGAGGLSAIPVGSFMGGALVGTAGPYVSAIVSDTELTFVDNGGAVSDGTDTITFAAGTGDDPTGTPNQYAGYVRALAGSLPSFLYFNKTYLDTFPLEKDTVWMTTAIPGSFKSAPNSFVTRDANRFRPPLDAGISMGGAAVDNGFVVPFSKKNFAIRNERDSGTGVDRDYHLYCLNEQRGCISWQSVGAGNRFAHLFTQEGLVACDLNNEMLISRDVYAKGESDYAVGIGEWANCVPRLTAATAQDTDTEDLYVRALRGVLWVNYDTTSGAGNGFPDRQLAYDYSAAIDQSGLAALRRPDGEPWGWSTPLLREMSVMCEGRRSDGGHLYGWNDEEANSSIYGRIDEFEHDDDDNGAEIVGQVYTPWIKNEAGMLSLQEINAQHVTPTGATVNLKIHRSYSDDSYSLTPTVSGSAISTDELILCPQGARVPARAYQFEWEQSAGDASELQKMEPKFKRLRRLRP